MILVSYDDFDQLAEYDPRTGAIQCWLKKERPELTASIVGSFARVNGKLISLYRSEGTLHLWAADQEFEITEDMSSELKDKGLDREFRLRQGPDVLVTITYRPLEPDVPLNIDPTPGVEAEHFDYMLLIHNVLTEPGRRDLIWND